MALHRSGYSWKKAELEKAQLEIQALEVENALLRRRADVMERTQASDLAAARQVAAERNRLLRANRQLLDDLQALATAPAPGSFIVVPWPWKNTRRRWFWWR